MTNEEAIKILQGMNLDLMYPNGEYAVDGLPEDKLKMYLATGKAIETLRRAQPANEPLTNTGGSFNGTGNVYNGTGPCGNICVGTGGGDSDANV